MTRSLQAGRGRSDEQLHDGTLPKVSQAVASGRTNLISLLGGSSDRGDQMRKPTSVSRLFIVCGGVAKVVAFVIVCVFAAVSGCSAQTPNCISVRALDYKKGKPLKNLSITIHPSRSWTSDLKTAKTDSIGIAKFCPIEPISTDFSLSLDGRFFESCSGYTFETKVILNTGYQAHDTRCGTLPFKFSESPKPGELVIMVRHIGWWERNTECP